METSDRSRGAKTSLNLFIINTCMVGACSRYNTICLAK